MIALDHNADILCVSLSRMYVPILGKCTTWKWRVLARVTWMYALAFGKMHYVWRMRFCEGVLDACTHSWVNALRGNGVLLRKSTCDGSHCHGMMRANRSVMRHVKTSGNACSLFLVFVLMLAVLCYLDPMIPVPVIPVPN